MNYYIQGNKDKAEEIKAAFEKLGYDVTGFDMCNDNILFFTYKLQTGGQVLSTTNANIYTADIIKTHPDYKELELPIEPKFKAEDRIVNKSDKSTIYRIIALHEELRKYIVDIEYKDHYESCSWIAFEDQDDYELVPKLHYDISNFKPYQKVLIRFGNNDTWRADFFSHIKEDRGRYFVGIGYANKQCIPFEGNEHLLGTTDMCDEQYINW